MPRYKMIANTESRPQIYRVVDSERPTAIVRTQVSEFPIFKSICECFEEGAAMMIADALNKADL
jgi:hypothetical protein